MGIDIRQQGQSLVVEFLKASVPDNLRRRLDVTDFEDKSQLRKVGGNLFDANQARAGDSNASLQPGFIEGSTVEPTQAMVSMIEVNRAYELNATLIGLADGTLSRAVNDIARLT